MSGQLPLGLDSSSAARSSATAESKAGNWGYWRGWLTHDYVLSFLLGALIVVALEISVRRGWISDVIVPAPSDVWLALRFGFANNVYWIAILSTLQATVVGFVCSGVIAIVLACVLSTFDRLERIVLPYIYAFQAMPKIALAPIVLLALGYGATSKIAVTVIVAFFPILINSLQGMRLRNREQIELMASLGASRLQLVRYLRLPNSIPYVFAGLNVGLIFALLGTVVAEFIGAPDGLGVLLLQQKAQFNTAAMWAVLIILMVMGVVLQRIMLIIERSVARWSRDISVTG
jgi:NitT/TauT family transport system permease protein